jgi:hypothetical protein
MRLRKRIVALSVIPLALFSPTEAWARIKHLKTRRESIIQRSMADKMPAQAQRIEKAEKKTPVKIVAEEDYKTLFLQYRQVLNDPSNTEYRKLFKVEYDKIKRSLAGDLAYHQAFKDYIVPASRYDAKVAKIDDYFAWYKETVNAAKDFNKKRFYEAAEKLFYSKESFERFKSVATYLGKKQYDTAIKELKTFEEDELSFWVMKSIDGIDEAGMPAIVRLAQMLDDKKFEKERTDFLSSKEYALSLPDLDLRAQYYFLMITKPIMEQTKTWTPKEISRIAKNLPIIDDAGHVDFFKTALPAMIKYDPTNYEPLILAAGTYDNQVRSFTLNTTKQNENVRNFYRNTVIKAITNVSKSYSSALADEMRREPGREELFSILPETERMRAMILGVPTITQRDLWVPYTYYPYLVDLDYFRALSVLRLTEAIPRVYGAPVRPITWSAVYTVADAMGRMLDEYKERKVEKIKFTDGSVAYDRKWLETASKLATDKEVRDTFTVALKGPTSQVKIGGEVLTKEYIRVTDTETQHQLERALDRFNAEAVNYHNITNMKVDFKNEDFVNAYLDMFVPDNNNVSTIYLKDEKAKTYSSRTYVKVGERWVNTFFEENLPETKINEKYARYYDWTSDVRLRLDGERFTGFATSTKITNHTALAALMDGNPLKVKELDKVTDRDAAMGVVQDINNMHIRSKIFSIRGDVELAPGILYAKEGKGVEVIGARRFEERGRTSAGLRWLGNRGYLETDYYQDLALSEYMGSVHLAKDRKERENFAAFLLGTAISRDRQIDRNAVGAIDFVQFEKDRSGKIRLDKDGKPIIKEGSERKLQASLAEPIKMATVKYIGPNTLIEGADSDKTKLLNGEVTHRGYGAGGLYAEAFEQIFKEHTEYFEEPKKYYGGGMRIPFNKLMFLGRMSVIEGSRNGYGWVTGSGFLPNSILGFIVLTTGEKTSSAVKSDTDMKWNIGTWARFAADKYFFVAYDENTKRTALADNDRVLMRSGLGWYAIKEVNGTPIVYDMKFFGEHKEDSLYAGEGMKVTQTTFTLDAKKSKGPWQVQGAISLGRSSIAAGETSTTNGTFSAKITFGYSF